MHSLELYLIAVSGVLALSVITSKATGRFGVPSLLVFLAMGMIAGSEGLGGIYFDNASHAQTLGVISLIYILFAGGLDTDTKEIRSIVIPGSLISTIGVLVTCGLTGWFAKEVLSFSWTEGLLLGAIVSSTDAAAVFTVLRGKGISFKGNIKPLLEFESGANDPMAVLLTVALLQVITGESTSIPMMALNLVKHVVVGGLIGYGAGRGMVTLFNKIKLEFEGLYPVLSLALVLLVYGVTEKVGGSGFLAVYIMGLVLSHMNFIRKKSLTLFHDGIAWLMQIAMFLTLGLLVFPSDLKAIASDGFLISAFLIFIARPAAVFISLMKSRFNVRQKLMISWVGLRGSVPIIMATYPLIAGIEKAHVIFNIVFFIVLTSIMFQGTMIGYVAKWLKVDSHSKPKFRFPIEYDATGADLKSDLVEVEVPMQSGAVGKTIIELSLPKDVLVVLIQREGNVIVPKGGTYLEAGDTMLVLAEKALVNEVRKMMLQPRAEV